MATALRSIFGRSLRARWQGLPYLPVAPAVRGNCELSRGTLAVAEAFLSPDV